ncbi:spore germination protein GerPC [Alkalihalobacterium chitinilyticum]|uniref:Spore germination protein GerPC n=1 Tax=Alkalihalobacterium chitinilyticum TaxID=2980103 RepID=A0ABT5VHH8_9BACI|nr:spore germination protein GerPC [Alkalihalobacterium chitinilyticum]MDE5413684.1 spore germination protein GerPC [Alkalihalobacterium chitinilyticum]
MVQSTGMNDWSGMNEMYHMSDEIHHNEEENNDQNEVKPKLQVKPQLPNFYQILEELKEKVEKVEEENDELKEKIEDLQPINIENINYKIQELAVEDLSGTLNIGITALTDPENLKKLLKDFEGINVNDVEENEMEMEELEKLDNFEIQPKPPNQPPQ